MKLRGDDSCMGRSTGLCPLTKKKACEEARQVRSAQKGMCMLGGPGKGGKVTVHKQPFVEECQEKENMHKSFFFDEILLYQYSF